MRRTKWGLVLSVTLILSACVTNPILEPGADGEFKTGLALYERGRYLDAIEHFNRAIDIDPEHARLYLYLGRSLFHLGRWLEAVSYLRGAYLRVPADQQKEVVAELLDSMLKGAFELFQKGNFVNGYSHVEGSIAA